MRAPGHEVILPDLVVKNPAALATFEAGTTILSAWGERYLVQHGHGRIARIAQFAQAGSTLYFVINNYRIAAEPGHPIPTVSAPQSTPWFPVERRAR